MGRPTNYLPAYSDTAAKVLANGESFAAVCAELDISKSTLYEWRAMFPEFEDACQRGLMKAQREWERIGKDGIIGNLEKFSATPWIFTMKNRFRDDYSEEKQDKTLADTFVEKLIDKLID